MLLFNHYIKIKYFSIYIFPDLIHNYWNNFDEKQFDMSIPSTKMVDQNEIDNQELEQIDREVSSIIEDEEDNFNEENTDI